MKIFVALAGLLFFCACSTIDPIVVPIDRIGRDLNDTQKNLDFSVMPDTHIHMKGSQLAIEKAF